MYKSILLLRKQENCWELPLVHFANGIRKIGLALLELHPAADSTVRRMFLTFAVSLLLLHRKRKSLTVELAAKNKKMTLTDKSIFSNVTTLYSKLLQTLALELIGKEKALKPFWNNRCLEMSRKLWLPTETDSAGLVSNSLSTSSASPTSNLLFSTEKTINLALKTSQKTSFPSFTYIRAETWEDEGIVTRKIRLYPTAPQRKILRQWMGTTRVVYNTALAYTKQNPKAKKSFYTLRNRFVTRKGNEDTIPSWQFETPKDIRAGALQDLQTATKAAFSNLKRGNILSFNLNFRSKKNRTASIVIPKSGVSLIKDRVSLYPTYMKESIKTSKDKAVKTLKFDHDCRLQFKNRQWFLCVPITVKTVDSNTDGTVCALDPGIRKFQTIYSEKEVVKLVVNKENKQKLLSKMDKLQSLRKRKQISKSHYDRGRCRQQTRLSNAVDDLHWKTIDYLTKQYRHIFLPRFESQEIVKKNKSKKTCRACMTLKHFQFRERLLNKVKLVRYCSVSLTTEEYTSKTCSWCGTINDVGSSEVYICKGCGLEIDRDVNGARNNIIKPLCMFW